MGCVNVTCSKNDHKKSISSSNFEIQDDIHNDRLVDLIPSPIFDIQKRGDRRGIHLSRAQALELYDQIFDEWEAVEPKPRNMDGDQFGEGGCVGESCNSTDDYALTELQWEKYHKQYNKSYERSRSVSAIIAKQKRRHSLSINLKDKIRRHSLSILKKHEPSNRNSSGSGIERRASCIAYGQSSKNSRLISSCSLLQIDPKLSMLYNRSASRSITYDVDDAHLYIDNSRTTTPRSTRSTRITPRCRPKSFSYNLSLRSIENQSEV